MISFKDIAGVIPITLVCDPPSAHHDLSKIVRARVFCGSDDSLRMYTPVLVDKALLVKKRVPRSKRDEMLLALEIENRGKAIRTYPFEQHYSPDNVYGVRSEDLYKVTDLSPFTGKIIDVDEFDVSKIEHIHDFVENFGTLYVNISDLSGINNFLGPGLKALQKAFKYVVAGKYELCNERGPARSKPRDLLTMTIAFHNLRYSVPLYDFKHISGMAVSVSLTYPETSLLKLAPTFNMRFFLTLSNYSNNIIEVDGQKIAEPQKVSSGLIEAALGMVERERPRRVKLKEQDKESLRSKRECSGAPKKRETVKKPMRYTSDDSPKAEWLATKGYFNASTSSVSFE